MTNEDEADRIRGEQIEKRAYEIHLARGYQHGFDQEDWLQAEREIDGLDEETFSEQEHDEPRTDEIRGA